MRTVLFSIVTVCLNDRKGLIRTQKSVRSQTNHDFEWIVIDGASRDGTKEFLEQLPADECQWISEPDKGLYDAMNKGIEKATGQYLLFLNSGDEFASEDVLQEVSKALSRDNKPDFVYGDSLERCADGTLVYKLARSHKYLWYGMFTHHQAMFYKKEAIGSLRYSVLYPIGADYGLTAALINSGTVPEYFPIAVCIFERGGISAKNVMQGAIDQFSIRRDILHYPLLVCVVIRTGHAIVRMVKKIAPSVYQSLRFARKKGFNVITKTIVLCSDLVRPNLVVVILTHNEEIHIERCIRSLLSIASKIFIVDSFSTDRTVEIAQSLGAEVAQRKWKNYADQFQWGLDNCGTDATWVMRMDADEYLEPGLQQELLKVLPAVAAEVGGIYIRRKVFFYGKWIRHGGFYPHILLRIWRNGKGRIEQRWMDEHIVLPPESKTIMVKEHLVDDNLKGITFWINKHNSYASREMVDLLNNKYALLEKDESIKRADDPQAKWKRLMKDEVYSRLPIGLRAAAYFFYRYFIRLGFLDGAKGFLWHFMQGFWYRLLVDIKIMEIEERCAGDVEKIKLVLLEEHGIKL